MERQAVIIRYDNVWFKVPLRLQSLNIGELSSLITRIDVSLTMYGTSQCTFFKGSLSSGKSQEKSYLFPHLGQEKCYIFAEKSQ